jgi:hypothetical protein
MAQPDGTLAEFAYRKCYGLRMKFRKVFLAGLVVVAISACGGGGGSSNLSDMVNDDSTETDIGDMEFEATGNKCLDAAQAFGFAIGSFGAAMTGEDWDIETYRKNMATARAAISDKLKPDFDIIIKAYDAYAEVIQKVVDAGGMATPEGAALLSEADFSFDEEEIQAASDRILMYFQTECYQFYGN